MSLGTKLRELRNEKKLSQTQIAVELDVSQTAYGKWESDQSKPGIDNLLKISEFYELDIYELLKPEDAYTQINKENSANENSSNNMIQNQTNNYNASEKLIEQYEARIKELQELNQELREQVSFWKNKTEGH
jgi:transcriptional regulator with XRE-family HTH domain